MHEMTTKLTSQFFFLFSLFFKRESHVSEVKKLKTFSVITLLSAIKTATLIFFISSDLSF